MNFGYLIVISRSDTVDYLKLAYALALSIKNTQPGGYDQVALVTDDVDAVGKLKSPWVFDYVIGWDQETYWDGRSWMDELSPFDSTVCLDADMLFLKDYSHWIDYFEEHCDLYIANKAYTYRGELITSDFYRKTFTKNKLPNLYSAYTWFKKGKPAVTEFFTLGRHIIKNPIEFKNHFLTEHKPKVVGTDEAFALSAQILDIADSISYNMSFPRFVHMKPMVQNWPWTVDKWTDQVGFYFDSCGKLKVGNFQQTDIFHYVEKDLITDEVVSVLEEIAWKKV